VFVLHEHDKPQHHFDLRLEEDGVLRSWAVPKGLPDDDRHDRLAVSVSDHDLEHASYTDATKRIADDGWWGAKRSSSGCRMPASSWFKNTRTCSRAPNGSWFSGRSSP